MSSRQIMLLFALAIASAVVVTLTVRFSGAYLPAASNSFPARITVSEPLRLSLPRPTTAPFYLDIDVSAFTPPRTGAVEVIVELEQSDGAPLEIGRFVPFPVEVFRAEDPTAWRGFRLDSTAVVSGAPADRPLAIAIRLKPIGTALEVADPAALTIARVAFADGY